MNTKLPGELTADSGLEVAEGASLVRHRIASGLEPLWVCEGHRCQRKDACARCGHDYRRGRLRQLKVNAPAMARLRQLVRQSEYGHTLVSMTDEEVLAQFIRLLDQGRWRLCAQEKAPVWGQYESGGTASPAPPPPSPPPRRAASTPAPTAPEAATFASSHDAAAQAQALKDAAQSGEPFCEECEKLRQQEAASAQESAAPPESSPDQDHAAQAQVLQEAAQSGAPFCEECEKLRQQQAAQAEQEGD